MRFLTPAWKGGYLSDEEYEALLVAYRSHHAELKPKLPAAARSFYDTVNMHDGLLRETVLDRSARTLRLLLRCGDNQQGYFDLGITYLGIRLGSLDVELLAAIARDPKAEALYHEWDHADGGIWVHRWLWTPAREIDFVFAEMEFTTEPREDRRFTRTNPPYVELGGIRPGIN